MANTSDGIYTRKDRDGFFIQWRDAQGRRRIRKTNARTLVEAKNIRAAELHRVEQAKMLGYTPPGEDTFSELAVRFLAHQKVRLSPESYLRETGIVNDHLTAFFKARVCEIRKGDIQRYIT